MFVENIELGSLFIVVLSTVFLGSVVFYRNRKNASNILFLLFSFSFSFWSIINYFSLHPPVGYDLFWIRLVLFSAAPQAFFFALLMHTFPKDHIQLSRRVFWAMMTVLLSQMVASITPFVFVGVSHSANGIVPIPGIGMPFYALSLIFFFSFGIYFLIRKFLDAKAEERKALIIMGVGFLITIALVLSFLLIAVVVFQNASFVPISPAFVLPLIMAIGYAVTRQKFLNIKLIATEFLVGLLTIVLSTEALLSGSWITIIWKLIFASFVAILGSLLIRSVQREIAQREELSKLAKSLEKANLRLKEIDQQKTEFLSIASHQLRTPLSILKGYIELIGDGAYGKPSKEMVKVLGDMDESNERLVKLVDEFLDITRIEQGRTKFVFEHSDMNKLIEGVVEELHERAEAKGLKIIWKPNKSIATVFMDEEKVRHVIFNYIDNAIKYSETGTIKVDFLEERGGIVTKVKDQGLGFNPVDKANFFQKFYRGENIKGTNVNGTGLGIYVCRKFIEIHGGHVFTNSAGLGKGSVFGFWIPKKDKSTKKKEINS
ncbi:MAG: hypothetical protein COX81_00070 [Candidatus Magasanikbacteria bacterium CG_4_10_14_0_2_um_filter_37_12]|uniref:histidine kinase n=1 Tax=Candidatus Magasanikbacteria bacterium CG_4_10_14_0_2_um_filter_37_12 TaxID=1974637 RepID=A0A2M7VAS7_9BACT|nr:MAG: hypothetical protein COX81_00070 [Candidatus Magasanikbacteria bacterium CG_4_10_14_0_2_um_filter_37_12]